MRNARYKTIPRTTKKVPYGIAAQRALLDLVERRFAQAELICCAVSRAHGKKDLAALTADETAPPMTDTSADEQTTAPIAAPAAKPDTDTPPIAASAISAETASDAPDTISADTPAASAPDKPLRAVTVIWHGKEETITHPEVWLKIFGDVSEAGDAITRELVRRRFRDEPYWKTCDALYLSHSAYYQNIREILHYALACATAYGILDPRPKHLSESA